MPDHVTTTPAGPRRFFSTSVRWRGFVDIALILAVTGTWLGLLGHVHWTLDLFSHFRWQYFILCLFGVAWTWTRRRPRIVQLILLASLLVNAVALYQVKGDSAFAATSGPRLRVVSLNVNITNPQQGRGARRPAHREPGRDRPDRGRQRLDERARVPPRHLPGPVVLTARRQLRTGVPESRAAPVDLELIQTSDHATPSVLARLTLDGRELAILATHPPPPINGEMAAARDEGLQGAATLVASLNMPVLLIGDLNATPWSQGLRLLRDGSTLDYRSADAAWTPTWNARTPFAIPIDHALVTPPLVVASRHIGPDVGSDHRPQVVEIGWQ